MINFTTNGKKESTEVICVVNFGTTAPSDRYNFNFIWETNDAHFAYLLAAHFRAQLQKKIREAHQRAYEIGYKDGKGKQKKKTNFDSYLGDNNPAY